MKIATLFCLLFVTILLHAQSSAAETFQRISAAAENYVVDTTAVPDDKLTAAIKKLRRVKGGFNINEAILFKIAEDRNKGDITKEESDKLEDFFANKNGKVWLENAVIHIHRNIFTLSEVKQLTKFYQSEAGKKMSANFPVIMLQSMKAAEKIIEAYKQK